MTHMNDVIRTVRGPYGPRIDRSTPVPQPATYPAPNPQQWCGSAPAARMIGVSVAHLYRLVARRDLNQYRPEGTHPLFWIPELQAYAKRKRS